MVQLVRAASLTKYTEIARECGLDPLALLRKHGMSTKLLADPERHIPILPVMALLEESAQLAACPSFGLRMAESREFADLGGIGLLLMFQRSLGDALTTLIGYLGMVIPAEAMSLEREGTLAVLRMRLLSGSDVYSPQSEELVAGVVWRMFEALFGPRLCPRAVHFIHAGPSDQRVHQRVFGCPVRFRSEFNGLTLAAADLAVPNPGADHAMARVARRLLDAQPAAGKVRSVAQEVRRAIFLLLPAGRATIEQVALGVGRNVRTLQRELEEEHVTFSELLDDVRGELVMPYLENRELSLARVAVLLGYRMPSSLTRWFTLRFGTAPRQWRKTSAMAPRRKPAG